MQPHLCLSNHFSAARVFLRRETEFGHGETERQLFHEVGGQNGLALISALGGVFQHVSLQPVQQLVCDTSRGQKPTPKPLQQCQACLTEHAKVELKTEEPGLLGLSSLPF